MMPTNGTKAADSIPGSATRAPWESAASAGFSVNGNMLFVQLAGLAEEITPWGYYPLQRDLQLKKLARSEPHIAGTSYSISSRISSLRWEIKGGARSKAYAQELLNTADNGQGFKITAGKATNDLLMTDNGAFIYKHGAGSPDKQMRGPVKALFHLDSMQCWRTHDPDYPVVYSNPYTAKYHRLHKSRVITMSSFPQSDEMARGIGFCAVSRTLQAVQIMKSIMTYRDEKISGRFKRAIGYGYGYTDKQFDQAIQQADETADSIGFTRYMGIPFLLTMRDKAELNMLDLASLPDGFDLEKETNLYIYALALGFGVDAREIWPATASGATKADATVQHLKAQGKGIGDLITTIEHVLNYEVMPGNAEFEYDFTDDEQDRTKAELDGVRIDNINKMILGGYLNPQQGFTVAVSQSLIDPKVVPAFSAPQEAAAPKDENVDETTAEPPPKQADATPADDATKEIAGKPLPESEAVKVEPFTEKEIDALFEAFESLPSLSALRKRGA